MILQEVSFCRIHTQVKMLFSRLPTVWYTRTEKTHLAVASFGGSLSPLDRLAEADTAIKECFIQSNHWRMIVLCSGVQVSAPLLWASANGMKWSMSNLLGSVKVSPVYKSSHSPDTALHPRSSRTTGCKLSEIKTSCRVSWQSRSSSIQCL